MTGKPKWKNPAGTRRKSGSVPIAKTTFESSKGNKPFPTSVLREHRQNQEPPIHCGYSDLNEATSISTGWSSFRTSVEPDPCRCPGNSQQSKAGPLWLGSDSCRHHRARTSPLSRGCDTYIQGHRSIPSG